MKLNLKIAALVAALALAALPTLQAAAKGAYYRYDFSGSLKPWASSAESGSKHTLQLLFEDDPNQERVMNGYANLQSGGPDPIGTGPTPEVPLPVGIWTLASFEAYGDVRVRVELNARSTKNCEGCILRAYIGRDAPATILQFSEVSDVRILKSSWQAFSYESIVTGKSARANGSQTIYVAFGWSGTDSSIGLDNIDILIFPAP